MAWPTASKRSTGAGRRYHGKPREERALVFGSMGPTGKLLQTGESDQDEIFETYAGRRPRSGGAAPT